MPAVLERQRTEVVAVYGRNSHGDKTPIAHQLRIGQRWCDDAGHRVHAVYSDRVSASRFATGPRADWPKLRDDVTARRITIAWFWESSRAERRLSTWAAFLEDCRDNGVRIWLQADERLYDLAIRRDWKTLADAGVHDEFSSAERSDAVQRGIREAAMDGKPHGTCTYGYERVYDERTGDLAGQRPHPEHAAVVREIIRCIGSGDPVASVRRDLMARGVPAPRGGSKWYRSVVRQIAMNRAYLGIRVHRGTEHAGAWQPLVTRDEWSRCAARLAEVTRTRTRPGAQRYMASYLAHCGKCGERLRGEPPQAGEKRPTYSCPSGHTMCGMEPLDAYLRDVVIATHLGMPGTGIPANSGEEARKALDEAEELQERLDAAAQGYADSKVSLKSLSKIEDMLTPRIAAARKRARELDVPPLPFDPAEDWESAPVHMRKVVARMLLGRIELFPAPGKKRGPSGGMDVSRVRVTWTTPEGIVTGCVWPGHDDERRAMTGKRAPWLSGEPSERTG
jgi:site-specific DNA recombinase